jgi:exodeoxyribonuclease V gamma subunit
MNREPHANRDMTGLHLITSNRMELLAERLAGLVREPLASALAPEIVVVQSRGMERWVSMELARINGISANVQFPFPNAFIESAFETVSSGLPAPSSFAPDVLAFRLMAIIQEHAGQADFEHLHHYLADDPRGVNLYQLSRKIADLFDQYLVFRPEMIECWEKGPAADSGHHRWQALIWQELARRTPGLHRVGQRQRLADAIRSAAPGLANLPRRVSLFGVSYLPRFHLEIFAGLSRLVEVHVFCMNPCREYWADIVSEREVQRVQRRLGDAEAVEERLHLERGNRLLASLGALGRNFLGMLAEFPARQTEEFVEPAGPSLLGRLQSDILNLRDPQRDPGLSTDASLRVHACHSAMREVEVLQDQMLAMFAEDPQLQPGEIIVMTPDIEAYAPFISAVFSAQGSSPRRIPFCIADRGPHRESSSLQAFFSLLDLADSRFGAGEVLRLLERPGILRRFGLESAHLPRLEQWVREARICWGEDEAAQKALGLPGHGHNTWRAGIERLLLGYALPSRGTEVFHGIRGYDAIEGSDARVLGPFLDFLEQVFALSRRLNRRQRLGAWRDELNGVISAFFPEDDAGQPELQRIRRLLDELAGLEQSAGFPAEVAVDVVRLFLSERLEREGAGRGFMSGGVTFCSMLPMRTIPFKVVCLIGMNHDAYPRESRQLTFDLMAQAPRPGDRSRRQDDKYLFLEALLSARRRLYISYVGQSIQDNSPVPPSVVVSELLDAVQTGYGLPLDHPDGALVARHRLQPFSAAYFQAGSGLFSYSAEDLQACAAAAAPPSPQPFVSGPIPLTGEEAAAWSRTDLERLESFFANPARFLLRRRLGVRLEEPEALPADSEPFVIGGLERFDLGNRLLEHRLKGLAPQDVFAALRADGRLPHGTMGAVEFRDLWSEVDRFARRLDALRPAAALATIDAQWDLAGFSLAVRLTGLSETGCLRYRFGRLRAKDHLDLWLQHLALCLAEPGQGPRESALVCTDYTLRLQHVANSRAVLEELLVLYRRGLEQPLCFFPRSSFEYARTLRKSSSETRALSAARTAWEGSEPFPGEGMDRYYRRCFETIDPLGADFRELSRRVFDPLLDCASSERSA